MFKKDFYNVLVHVLQNIDKHCLPLNNKKDAILLIARTNGNYIINSGNFICNTKIDALQQRLVELNEQKVNGNLPDNNEQGMGFIEIVRASKKELGFSFEKIDEEKHFFSLSVTI